MTHADLCDRAARWLSGTRRCTIVLGGIASCAEIPDAVGWRTGYNKRTTSTRYNHGSTVVECKTSREDFLRDKHKRVLWKQPNAPDSQWHSYRGYPKKALVKDGFISKALPRMGTYRYFLTPKGLVGAGDVQIHYPDHGLLWIEGRRVREVIPAPKRAEIDMPSEIALLVMAIRHIEQRLLNQGIAVNLRRLTTHPMTDRARGQGKTIRRFQ